MAYSDNRGVTFNPASLAGTVAFNGLVALAAIMAAVTVLPPEEDGNGGITIYKPDPVAAPKTDKPVKTEEKNERLATNSATPQPLAPPTDNTLVDTGIKFAGEDFPLGPVGTDIEPKIEPLQPVQPTLTTAFVRNRDKGLLQPEYPLIEQRLGNEGRVTVRVLIGTDGRVTQVEPVSFTSEAFLEATRKQALKKWRFSPATRDGVPVESWHTMSVRFEITTDG
jgi:periplasmic protein TonB